MLPANPPPHPRPPATPSSLAAAAVLFPSNVSFFGGLSRTHALSPRGNVMLRLRALSTSSGKTTTIGGGAILPNAIRRRRYPGWGGGGFSLGVDLGASRTGIALGKGFCPRPLAVLDLRGQKLESRLLEIAEREEVDEFIIGLPKSHDGKETSQSNKVRSIAEKNYLSSDGTTVPNSFDPRGWRVYLQDEHGTTLEALDVMIERGLKRSARQGRIDAYSAMMVLERYFSTSGSEAELVLPKQLDLQEKLRIGSHQESMDF